jgi:hypothetical protein
LKKILAKFLPGQAYPEEPGIIFETVLMAQYFPSVIGASLLVLAMEILYACCV